MLTLRSSIAAALAMALLANVIVIACQLDDYGEISNFRLDEYELDEDVDEPTFVFSYADVGKAVCPIAKEICCDTGKDASMAKAKIPYVKVFRCFKDLLKIYTDSKNSTTFKIPKSCCEIETFEKHEHCTNKNNDKSTPKPDGP